MSLGSQKLRKGINTSLTIAYVMLSYQLSYSEAVFANLNTTPTTDQTKQTTINMHNQAQAYNLLHDPDPRKIPVSELDKATISQVLFEEINAVRKNQELKPLIIDHQLQAVMQDLVLDMESNNHNTNLRMDLHKRLIFPKNLGDIIAGTSTDHTISQVLAGWMAGKHKEFILSSEYDTVGIGYHEGQWLVIFMNR